LIMKTRIFFTAFTIITCLSLLKSQDINLNGPWSIAVDPTEKGVEYDWHQEYTANSDGLVKGWDVVTVPHFFTLDNRFNIFGKVWYRKTFTLSEDIMNKVCRIRFAAAHYKTRLWVNDVFMGIHEGGYTPFLFDLSRVVKSGVNYISVEVDNRWSDNTIPGSRPETGAKDQVYPWYEYGGITQNVSLLITDKAFIIKQNDKILKEWPLPILKPGMTHTIDLSGVYSPGLCIEVVNPKGFVVYGKNKSPK
jgi:beta-glucuronidase